jgi:anaerobic selenocysteine-containing dehydrogenase
VFGAGGGTSSYEEVRNADLIILWGSNELNFAAQKFGRVALRTNNIDSCNRT